MKKICLSLVILCFILSGCNSKVITYHYPQGQEAQFKKDLYKCENEASSRVKPNSVIEVMGASRAEDQIIKECLESKGYTVSESDT